MNNREMGRMEGFLLGAIVGALISSIVSLLFAPKSGKELREDIVDNTNKTLEHADDYVELARKKGSEVMGDVEKIASTYWNVASDKVDDAVSKSKSMFKHSAEEVDETVEKLADKYMENAENGQKYNTYQFK